MALSATAQSGKLFLTVDGMMDVMDNYGIIAGITTTMN
jgi:hypothetical protein